MSLAQNWDLLHPGCTSTCISPGKRFCTGRLQPPRGLQAARTTSLASLAHSCPYRRHKGRDKEMGPGLPPREDVAAQDPAAGRVGAVRGPWDWAARGRWKGWAGSAPSTGPGGEGWCPCSQGRRIWAEEWGGCQFPTWSCPRGLVTPAPGHSRAWGQVHGRGPGQAALHKYVNVLCVHAWGPLWETHCVPPEGQGPLGTHLFLEGWHPQRMSGASPT